MSRPSKTPPALVPLPAATSVATQGNVPEAEAVLTRDDWEFLASLDPSVTGDEGVRSDMLALLTDDETVEALLKYAPVLAAVGIQVAPVVSAAPEIKQLQRMRRRLDLAQSVVGRHIQAKGAPSVGTSSALRRFVAATPEGSPLRLAFSLFMDRWEDIFRGPGRPAKSAEARAPVAPDASDKTPPTK